MQSRSSVNGLPFSATYHYLTKCWVIVIDAGLNDLFVREIQGDCHRKFISEKHHHHIANDGWLATKLCIIDVAVITSFRVTNIEVISTWDNEN